MEYDMPLDERGTKILEKALDTGNTDLFHVLADHVEENGMPTLAGILRNHSGHSRKDIPTPLYSTEHEPDVWHPPENRKYYHSSDPDNPYDDPENEPVPTPRTMYRAIKGSPQIIPNVHLVRDEEINSGERHGSNAFNLHDLRHLSDEDRDYLDEDQHDDWLNLLNPHHHFDLKAKKYPVKGKLELAKPIPVYEDPGDEVHITGLSKGGNCEHCGKPDIYRIHVKHPVSGETCKIGSSCASGMLRDNSKKNLTGKMQPKDILHKAATAESLKDVGSVVKVRLKNKDTKLTKAPPDTKETLAREEELEHEPLKSLYHQGVHEGDNFALHILSDQLEERGHPLLATIFRRGAAYREKYGTDHNDKYQTAKQYVSEGDDILRTTQEKRRVGTQGMFTEGFGPHYPWLTILTPHKKNPKYKDVGLRVPLRASEMREYGEKYGHWSTGDGEKAKDAKVEDAPESLELSRGISVEPDTHSQEEIYAALVAEGVEPTKAEELSHALS